MEYSKYNYYLDKTKKDFKELIESTQSKLDKSKSKGEDYYLLNCFWNKFSNCAIAKWLDSSTLLCDDTSMCPMPESVSKQFVNMLFKIKNLDVLFDLEIYEGFEDYDYYKNQTKSQVINYYKKEMFKEEI